MNEYVKLLIKYLNINLIFMKNIQIYLQSEVYSTCIRYKFAKLCSLLLKPDLLVYLINTDFINTKKI